MIKMSQFMGYFRMVLDKNRRVFRVFSKESVFVHTTESEKRKKKNHLLKNVLSLHQRKQSINI